MAQIIPFPQWRTKEASMTYEPPADLEDLVVPFIPIDEFRKVIPLPKQKPVNEEYIRTENALHDLLWQYRDTKITVHYMTNIDGKIHSERLTGKITQHNAFNDIEAVLLGQEPRITIKTWLKDHLISLNGRDIMVSEIRCKDVVIYVNQNPNFGNSGGYTQIYTRPQRRYQVR